MTLLTELTFNLQEVAGILLLFSSIAGAYYLIYDRTSRLDERLKASESERDALKENMTEAIKEIAVNLKETTSILQQMKIDFVQHVSEHKD